jgi:hypothetical protein
MASPALLFLAIEFSARCHFPARNKKGKGISKTAAEDGEKFGTYHLHRGRKSPIGYLDQDTFASAPRLRTLSRNHGRLHPGKENREPSLFPGK